ncbi:MAG TPA: thiol-disulfide oxidoreductase DCC family protein [Bacteroidia bacterium]|jgi:predicted DCC family thiol-disulfide oxidoreductase YuxK|nr:thiol-disulfide oxidoreductase DCC family protein [Bacteroidia bacterium]
MDNLDSKAIVLFDGVCNFCDASVNFIIRHDKKDYFRFAPLQSEKGKQLLQQFNVDTNELNTFILLENNKIYTRSTASLKVTRRLSGAYFLLYAFMLVPPFIRDAVYNLIAKNRYKLFGKKDNCMVPTPEVKDKFIF